MKRHYQIRVVGTVQGVFFRVSTQKEAVKLGLSGYVKNLVNGNVYIEVEGDIEKIDTLVGWLNQGGPPKGVVNQITITERKLKNFTGFEIR